MKKFLLSALAIASLSLGASAQYTPRMVVEEGTGAWCGWCIRGIVGFHDMIQEYDDNFIGIAVHNGDEMAYDSYLSRMGLSSLPSANVNRKYMKIDPSYTKMKSYMSQLQNSSVNGMIELTAELNANKTAYTVKTKSTFAQASDSKYKVAIVLTEDYVMGEYQNNYYAGGGYGVMGGYESMPSKISPFIFQHVARLIFPSYDGEEIADGCTAGQVVENEFNVAVPASVSIVDNVNVIAMLIEDGVIINGAEIKHGEVIMSIPEVTALETEESAYAKTAVSATISFKNDTENFSMAYLCMGFAKAAEARDGEDIAYTSKPQGIALAAGESKTADLMFGIAGIPVGDYTMYLMASIDGMDYEIVSEGEPITLKPNPGRYTISAGDLLLDGKKYTAGEDLVIDNINCPVDLTINVEEGGLFFNTVYLQAYNPANTDLGVESTNPMVLVEGGVPYHLTTNLDLSILPVNTPLQLIAYFYKTNSSQLRYIISQSDQVVFTISESAGIHAVETSVVEEGPVAVYNFQGIRVSTLDSRADAVNLPAGFYIIGGKKVVVR